MSKLIRALAILFRLQRPGGGSGGLTEGSKEFKGGEDT